ncbi:transmembrane prediction [Pseudomonas sp. M47T1]|uniref:DUF3341 domain-containing protein n=1 Tax=Pseudomonas sp. M47T1 TaxID=1179778 RepID=UPI00026072D6|nr:DUF3341 domain-containing protein [Pseudomonas sp. M47T1]EIK94792.1 transmembrane prediction [Pseudomonas sp. M47T1]
MSEPWGLLAEFDQPGQLVVAVSEARALGYRRFEAFAPFAVEALAPPAPRVGWLGAGGALAGAATGVVLQVATALAWPTNVGGRPLVHWPSLLIVTFLLSVLGAAVASVIGLLWQARLPRLHHPLFEAPVFVRASDDRFLLCILADDPLFQRQRTGDWLAIRALSVTEVLS